MWAHSYEKKIVKRYPQEIVHYLFVWNFEMKHIHFGEKHSDQASERSYLSSPVDCDSNVLFYFKSRDQSSIFSQFNTHFFPSMDADRNNSMFSEEEENTFRRYSCTTSQEEAYFLNHNANVQTSPANRQHLYHSMVQSPIRSRKSIANKRNTTSYIDSTMWDTPRTNFVTN